MRVKKEQVERLVELRKQLRRLKAEEQKISKKLKGSLEIDHPIFRGSYKVAITECLGQPKWKDAFIEIAGQEAADQLPRGKYVRLNVIEV